MATTKPRPLIRIGYYEAAQKYLHSLPLEHFTEATTQGRQRAITLTSFAILKAHRTDFHYYNELLVQYPLRGSPQLGQVVPDNMVVISEEPPNAEGSYDLPLTPARPFFVLEYVSRSSKRKDYEESYRKYERELKVPYYLFFYADDQELTLFRHNGRKYIVVKPNELGRLSVQELDLEVVLLDRWVRYWYKGRLLPLPEELEQQREEAQRRAELAERELAMLRAQLQSRRKNGS